MRILHYATGTIIGGIATLVYDLCKEQVKRYGGRLIISPLVTMMPFLSRQDGLRSWASG